MDNAGAWTVVQQAIESVTRGRPTVLVIEGEAGLGKSRLMKRLSRGLDGFEVHRAFGEPDAPDVAFSTLRELTASTGIAEPVNAFQAVSELLALVDERQRVQPLAFLIDDLQWTDAESIRALAGLLRRVEGDRLLVAVATRPLGRAHSEWQRMLRDANSVVIQLGGLTVDEVGEIAREADPSATDEFVAALHEHTAGNPLHVISLLGEHTVASLTEMADADELPAPLELAQHVESRIQSFSPDAGELLSALAVLGDGWVSLDTAAAVAGVDDARAAARVLTEERLVRTRGATLTDIRIFHSVIRAAVYEVIPDARARRLHRAAAERVMDPSARLRHRLASMDAAADPELAAELVAYADAQHTAAQYREAARFLRMAATVTAQRDAADALLQDAQFESVLGADPEAYREQVGTGDARDRLVVALSFTDRAEWQRGWAVLVDLDDDTIAALPDRIAFRVRVLRAFDAMGAGRPAPEIFADLDAAERLRDADPALQRHLLFTKLQVSAWTFAGEAEFWEMSGFGEERSVLASTRQGTALLAWRGINHALDGTPEEAIADLSTATALIGTGGLDFTEGTYHSMLGLAHYLAGDVARAGASIEVSLSTGLAYTHPVSLAISGLRELLGGDARTSRAIMAEVRAGLLRNRYKGAMLTADTVDLLVLAAVGSDAERREWVRRRRIELGDPLVEDLNLVPTLWLGLHGLAATWVDDAVAAKEWSARLQAVAFGTEWRDAMVAWIAARVSELGGTDATDALAAFAREEFTSIPVLRGLVAREAAASARRHGRPDAAQLRLEADALVVAVAVAEDATAGEPETAVATESDIGVLAALSDRERAVVALVAGGMSYAQIAKELYITRSTVGFHLSNCYAKTGTHTRHELADLAREAGMSPRLPV
ncbi:LuxR family transcriptional regulator [Microbacterium aoyamense]|uniref:LuxR family transcriptional regulator n=1 Tax=Microbacterium aoyamense TaxID=344166 RepID=A0ABP5AN87_9MICO|nr:LuxR family transcriptional regulator [Microbacterium aoyamense]